MIPSTSRRGARSRSNLKMLVSVEIKYQFYHFLFSTAGDKSDNVDTSLWTFDAVIKTDILSSFFFRKCIPKLSKYKRGEQAVEDIHL